jgi:hypothetical protein
MTIASTSNPATLKRTLVEVGEFPSLGLLGIPVKPSVLRAILMETGYRIAGNLLLLEHIFRADENTGKYASVLNKDGTLFVAACADAVNILILFSCSTGWVVGKCLIDHNRYQYQ